MHLVSLNSRSHLARLMLCGSLGFSVGACAEDDILDVGECGNGILEGSEGCDNDSVGCAECLPVSGFKCTDNACEAVCGDGILAGNESCDDPADPECNTACQKVGARGGCDMSGYWLARQTDFSVDDVFGGLIQTSSNFFVLELTQDGEAFEVKHSTYCGIRVSGTVDVTLTPGGTRSLLNRNPQGQNNQARAARRGLSRLAGDTCEFKMDRWYVVRGIEEDLGVSALLPDDFSALPELGSLPPIPIVPDDERTNPDFPSQAGADDWDGDGIDGLAFVVTGIASGTRNVVMRDWFEYFSTDRLTSTPGSNEFTVVSVFDNQENILFSSQGGALLAGSVPAPGLEGQVTFRFLGRSLEEAAVADLIQAPLGSDDEADYQMCLRVQEALPHLDSKDLGVSL